MSKAGNNVSFIGRFVNQPELRTINDTCVCNFCLARNKDYSKDGEKSADFIDCVAWGKTAEIIVKFFDKGTRIGVHGALQSRTYKNNSDFTVKVTEINVEQIEFIDLKKDSFDTNSTTPSSNSTNNMRSEKSSTEDVIITDDDDDDLPF